MMKFNPFSNTAEEKKKKVALLKKFGISKLRYIFVLILMAVFFIALIIKAIDVQIISAHFYQNEADKYYVKDKVVPFVRGAIVDRNRNLLSVSVPMNLVIADPKVVLDYEDKIDQERWLSLTNMLNISSDELWQKIKRNPKSRYLVLAKDFTLENGEYIRQLRIKGITTENVSKRFYPRVEEAAHLIGYVDNNNEGIEGLEKSFNSYLIGQNGKEVSRKDSRGNLIERVEDVKSQDAREIVLSIDEKLQSIAYREIKKAVAVNKADSGTAVLVDVRTGEILAMANAPSYNPNNREGLELDVLRNRAITDTFEPASTVKPFVILTALQRGVVRPNEMINTQPFLISGKEIRDVSLHEQLSLTGILQKSSNVGVSRLALRMPPTALIDTYSSIGFGKPTELGLGGEQKGSLSADRKRDIERAALSYGYGLSVTPLQLARAYATLGSFGIYRPLSITKVDPPVIGDRVFSEKLTQDVVGMMEAVTHEGGGGVAAAVEGYRVAVKTGTAKMLENGQYVEKYRAYTAGVAPVSNPRFALVVLINNPTAGKYYGGAISAPVFSEIMGNALRSNNIAPDNLQSNKTAKRVIYLQRSSDVNTPRADQN